MGFSLFFFFLGWRGVYLIESLQFYGRMNANKAAKAVANRFPSKTITTPDYAGTTSGTRGAEPLSLFCTGFSAVSLLSLFSLSSINPSLNRS